MTNIVLCGGIREDPKVGGASIKFDTIAGDYQLLPKCMTRGNQMQPINSEIDRTFHKLVRQNRSLPLHSESFNISSIIVINTDFVSLHSVAYSDSVYYENMPQPSSPGPR
ncbi:hypothetical protein Lal_00013770 [Lupinus albus]|nr:hypothetical protein Lal_00013770 [Lupinus albus]